MAPCKILAFALALFSTATDAAPTKVGIVRRARVTPHTSKQARICMYCRIEYSSLRLTPGFTLIRNTTTD